MNSEGRVDRQSITARGKSVAGWEIGRQTFMIEYRPLRSSSASAAGRCRLTRAAAYVQSQQVHRCYIRPAGDDHVREVRVQGRYPELFRLLRVEDFHLLLRVFGQHELAGLVALVRL